MTNRTLNDIAKNLKIARLQKRLTQDEVASKAGVSTNYYARLERAELKPSVEYLEKIVKALGIKSSDILPF